MKLRAGFTLIELIIFTAIFSLAMGAFLNVFTNISGVAVRQNSTVEVQSQSQFVLQTIQHYVERSSMVSMDVDATSTVLTLRMSSTTEDPVIIDMNGTAIQLKVGDGEAQTITSNKVEVSGLNFTRYSNPGGKNSVSVSFTITYAAGNTTQRFSQSIHTAVARVAAATFDSDIAPDTGAAHVLGPSSGDWRSINGTIFFSDSNVGIGDNQFTPAARLHVQGDVLVESNDLYVDSLGHGVILRSPNNSCWRLNVDRDNGSVSSDQVTCP